MARHNIVSIFGMIVGDPTIIKDRDTGEYKKGLANIILVRGERKVGDSTDDDGSLRYDRPMLFSGNPEIIAKMENLKQNDLVEIKGFLTTMNISKKTTCTHCGTTNSAPGTMTFISPIYLDIRKTDSTQRDSLIELKEHMEISNQVLLIGNLCDEVKYYKERGFHESLYQLAVNRKFYLNDGMANIRTDYPFVRSFGENAELDAKSLYKGSCVLVDGRIHTRSYSRASACQNPNCGEEYLWTDNTIEVIPYSVEYLQNYHTAEDLERMEKEELDRIKKNVFSS